MPDLKLLRIEEGDNQKNLVDKVNSNFSNIITFGGGPYGKLGQEGPEGDKGATGPVGSYGDMGARGSIWVVGITNPGTTGYINGDFWFNLTPGSGNQIYQFSSEAWSPYGFNLLSQDLFRIYPNVPTSAGDSSYNGYHLTSINPSDYTLVLSDNSLVGATASTNPQYSKLVLSIDGGAIGKGLLEFSKYEYSSSPSFTSKTPRFLWSSTSTSASLKYGLSLRLGDSLFIDIPNGNLGLNNTSSAGSNLSHRSTGFNLYLTESRGLSVTTSGDFILNFSSTGTALFSNRNITYTASAVSVAANFSIPVSLTFSNSSADSLPPLWLSSSLPNVGGLRHRTNVASSRSSSLFYLYGPSEFYVDVRANGEFWYNKRINSIQPVQNVTSIGTGNVTIPSGPTVSTQWYAVVPGVVYAAGTPSQRINSNNGIDFVVNPATSGPSTSTGVYLWTPATGATADSNGGFLNLLNDHESIELRVRTASESKFFRFVGLGTSNTFSDLPYVPYTSYQAADLSGSNSVGASHIDFTIMNITGTGSTAGTSRWFKVYYSAYGGNLNGSKCGILYTTGSTAI
jgi:hypothetical protein